MLDSGAGIVLGAPIIRICARRVFSQHTPIGVQNESSLLSVSSGCVGFLRGGRGVAGSAAKRSVRLDRGGTFGGAGP